MKTKNVEGKMEAEKNIVVSQLPTYLYGVGELAEIFMESYIVPNNIKIEGVVISKKYFVENAVFCGYSVQVLEEVLNENLRANIVLCFLKDNYDDVIENLKKIAPNCNFVITQKMFLEELKSKINALYEE